MYEAVDDAVAVGARHCEQRGCAECDAAETVRGFGFGRWKEPVVERGGLAEYAVGQVEHGSGGECGPIGFYAEEMLQPEEEGDVEVGGFNGRC